MSDTIDKQKYVSADVAHQNFINNQWRPLMAWLYMGTCAFDFLIAPIVWPIFQAATGVGEVKPWMPITLQGAGLYHLAMGAILGITSWQRSQERISAMSLQMNYSDPNIAERKAAAARRKRTSDADPDMVIDNKR
jgi:hypothetical protein